MRSISARDLPPLKALRAFEAVGRHKSVSRAADELGVTAGAVSRQVKALEEWLDTTLLIRGHRQIDLTPAGRRYMGEIAKALALIVEATRPLVRDRKKVPLRICSFPTFTQRWLIARWKAFNRRHPDIAFEFTTSMTPMEEPPDSYDALICLGHPSQRWDGWVALHLYRIQMVPVCSPGLLESVGGRLGPENLSEVSLIRGKPRPDDWARWLADNGVEGVDPESGPMFENFNFAIQAANEGAGVLLADRVLAADELAAGRLVQPFGPGRETAHSFYLVFPSQSASDRRLTLFAEWLKEQVGV